MGPKKDAKKANAEVKEGEDPLVLLQNYQKYCKYVSPSTALFSMCMSSQTVGLYFPVG